MLVHLASKDAHVSGVASYADTLDTALRKHAADTKVVRVDGDEYLERFPALDDSAIILADIGVNEGKEFQALLRQAKARPTLKRIITVHDPPKLAHALFAFPERISAYRLGRGLRRAINLLAGTGVERRFVLPGDTFVCLTSAGAEALRMKLTRLLGQPTSVHHVPLLNYLDPPPAYRRSADAAARAGYFGFIHPHKGLHVLVDAAALLAEREGMGSVPEIELRGRPHAEGYLENLKRKVERAHLDHKIRFGGFIPDVALPDFVQTLDALLLPYQLEGNLSASGPLGWARTCGVPVIASRTQGLSTLVEDGVDGLLLPPRDPATWAEALKAVAKRAPAWQKLLAGAHRRQHEAAWPVVVAKFLELCREGRLQSS